jgi:RNA polymerase sigma-70 factor (ECF subfamily)
MFKVREGDLDKMGLLFERHHRALYGFFVQMLKQGDLSKDLVQTVFFKMLKSRHTFTGSGPFVTWMYHIARNVLHDHYREVKRKGVHTDPADMNEDLSGGTLADERTERKEDLQMLALAMDMLQEKDRELLVLCRYQELKYSEIAHLLNITEGTVKVRVFRALNQLREHYLRISTEKNCA